MSPPEGTNQSAQVSADRRLTQALKRQRALEMRLAGSSYDQIAEALGYANRGGAHKAVDSALRRAAKGPAELVRELEAQRLDSLQMHWWVKAISGDVLAFRAILRLMDRRAKLLGLDAPQKITTTVEMTDEQYARASELERLRAIVAVLERARPAGVGGAAERAEAGAAGGAE
jgi:hypothetical protein